MRSLKHPLQLLAFIIVIVFSMANGKVPARANTPEGTTYLLYLPAVTTPAYLYFPLVFKAMPDVPMGPYGGSIVALKVDPSDPDILYGGSWGDGVFKSYDGGKNWYSSSQGITNGFIDSLAVDPVNTQVVYAGTQMGGIFKSEDGGQTWYAVNNGIQANAVVYSIAVNFENPNIVYASTRDGAIGIPGPYGGRLYRSTDAGASWKVVLQNIGSDQDWVYSIAANPTAPATIYAASHEHGVYISKDYGATWALVSTVNVSGKGRALAIDPRPGYAGVLYYGVWFDTSIYKSTNGGNSWINPNTGMLGTHVYPNGIVIAPSNPDTLYVADFTGHGVMKTTNAAGTWKSAGLGGINIYSVAVDPRDANRVWAGVVNNGLYLSEDGGANWSRRLFGITNTQVSGMVFSADTYLYAATGGGVYRSSDQGTNWDEFNQGLGNLSVIGLSADPQQPDHLFAWTAGGLYQLDAQRGQWKPITNGLPSAGMKQASVSQPVFGPNHPFNLELPGDEDLPVAGDTKALSDDLTQAILDLKFAPSQPEIVYTGTDGYGLYSSADSGSTWQPAGLDGSSIWGVSVSPDDPKVVYAAAEGTTQIQFTRDGGASWNNLSDPDPGVQAVYSVLVPAGEPDSVYAGTNVGVWKWDGAEWSQAGLGNNAVPLLVSDPLNPTRIYAGTTRGAYFSNDGTDWSPVTASLADSTIRSISFDPADPNHIFFGTTLKAAMQVAFSRN